jgi:hypothetical protein
VNSDAAMTNVKWSGATGKVAASAATAPALAYVSDWTFIQVNRNRLLDAGRR